MSPTPRPAGWAPGPVFYRASAVCAALAVLCVGVAQLGLAGYPRPGSLGERMALYVDPTFRAQGWVIFAQVVLMFVALVGVLSGRARDAAGAALTAACFVLLWQVLEVVPRAVETATVAHRWAPRWLASADPVERAAIESALGLWNDAWWGLGVVRRLAWGTAHLLLGIAFLRPRTGALETALAAAFLFNAARLLPRVAGELTGWAPLAGVGAGRGWFLAGMLPLFGLAALWLWRRGGEA